jgi:TonB family protein
MPSAASNLRSDEQLSRVAQHPPRIVPFTQDSLFALLPERRPPWKEFVFSMGTQSVLLFVLAWIGVLHPEILTTAIHNDHFVPLVTTPVPVPQEPAPVRFFKTPAARLEVPPAKALPLVPPPQTRVEQPAEETPEIHIAESKPAPVQPAAPAIPRQLVKTNVFSSGSSATPTMARAPQQVQTGGFGDPDGVPARNTDGRPVNIAQLGSFDAPSGPGSGNGTGGSRGTRGVIASSGFGNGVATGDGTGRTNTSRGNGIRQSGFGDMEPAAAPTRSKPLETTANMVPAEITSKPNPVYTEEARKLHIEGEVLLEVVFESSGRMHVVRVIRGLGHGLDEAAVHAAEQIRFKPALRDGKPADSTAVLHILFQLA